MNWLMNVALKNGLYAPDAIIDIHETPRLITISPNLDFVLASSLRINHFSADSRGRFFSAAIPGSMWNINVVKPCDAALQAKILFENPTHALTEKLFPAVAVFRKGRIGVLFLYGDDVRASL